MVLILVDGMLVVVPDSLDLITPYVLSEQLDFFEDELRFVRRLLRPGHKVIDIGANYGVYSVSMAKRGRGERSRVGIRAGLQHRGVPETEHFGEWPRAGDARAKGSVQRIRRRAVGIARPRRAKFDPAR